MSLAQHECHWHRVLQPRHNQPDNTSHMHMHMQPSCSMVQDTTAVEATDVHTHRSKARSSSSSSIVVCKSDHYNHQDRWPDMNGDSKQSAEDVLSSMLRSGTWSRLDNTQKITDPGCKSKSGIGLI